MDLTQIMCYSLDIDKLIKILPILQKLWFINQGDQFSTTSPQNIK